MRIIDYIITEKYAVWMFVSILFVIFSVSVAIIISRRSTNHIDLKEVVSVLPELDPPSQTTPEKFVCQRTSLEMSFIDHNCLLTVDLPPKFDGFGAVLVNHKLAIDVESGCDASVRGYLSNDSSRAHVRISAFKCGSRNYGSSKKPVSFAEKCGLRIGDVIGAINGVCSNSSDDLVMLLLEACRSGNATITLYIPHRGPMMIQRGVIADSDASKGTRKSILAQLLPRSFSLENVKSAKDSVTSLNSRAIAALELSDSKIDFNIGCSQSSPRSDTENNEKAKRIKLRSMSPFRNLFRSKSPSPSLSPSQSPGGSGYVGLNSSPHSDYKPSLIRRALSKSTSTSSSF